MSKFKHGKMSTILTPKENAVVTSTVDTTLPNSDVYMYGSKGVTTDYTDGAQPIVGRWIDGKLQVVSRSSAYVDILNNESSKKPYGLDLYKSLGARRSSYANLTEKGTYLGAIYGSKGMVIIEHDLYFTKYEIKATIPHRVERVVPLFGHGLLLHHTFESGDKGKHTTFYHYDQRNNKLVRHRLTLNAKYDHYTLREMVAIGDDMVLVIFRDWSKDKNKYGHSSVVFYNLKTDEYRWQELVRNDFTCARLNRDRSIHVFPHRNVSGVGGEKETSIAVISPDLEKVTYWPKYDYGASMYYAYRLNNNQFLYTPYTHQALYVCDIATRKVTPYIKDFGSGFNKVVPIEGIISVGSEVYLVMRMPDNSYELRRVVNNAISKEYLYKSKEYFYVKVVEKGKFALVEKDKYYIIDLNKDQMRPTIEDVVEYNIYHAYRYK